MIDIIIIGIIVLFATIGYKKGLILSAHILNEANNFFTPYPQLAILDPNNTTSLSNKILCKHPSIEKVSCAVCMSRFLLF